MNWRVLVVCALCGVMGACAGNGSVGSGVRAVVGRPGEDVNPPMPRIGGRVFYLMDFGGVGDGKTYNTEAFGRAVAAIHAAGGGQLIVPAGVFLTLPIELTSGMDLHLEPGATIQFPGDIAAYGLPAPGTATQEQLDALKDKVTGLVCGDHLSDVAITGSGTIDGGGAMWWKWAAKGGKKKAGRVSYERPKLILIKNSERVLVQGVTLRNSPMYNVVPTLCRDVRVEDVSILEPVDSPNTDGVDPIACENVLIRNCAMDDGDDSVAIKAIGGVCCNVLVENLHSKHGHGISIGSETNGGIHDVFVKHCTFDGAKWAVRIKSARDRGNELYGFTYDGIQMKDVGTAIDIDMYYHDTKGEGAHAKMDVTATTPRLRDVVIRNVTVSGAAWAGRIIGLPEMPIDGVTLTNVQIEAAKGMDVRDAKNVVFNQVKIMAGKGKGITEENAEVVENP